MTINWPNVMDHPVKASRIPFDPLDPRFIEATASRLRTSRKVALMLGRQGVAKAWPECRRSCQEGDRM